MVMVNLRRVSKLFGDVRAIDDIDLEIREDELFFLLGPSGCGKTTTLRVIAGFYKPDTGQVLFDDRIINDVPAYKRNIGMVFQNYALWPHMTVYDNIVYGLKIRDVPKAERDRRAEEVLEIVQLGGLGLRYPNQLSGGQQQRVALARAIVTEPELLLMDEPLSNLDAKLRLDTRKEIKRIQRDLGITSIYVTHDQDEALSMADRIAVMNNGKIEQIGSPREIYGNPSNSFVAGFIGETNFIPGTVESDEDDVIKVNTSSGDCITAIHREQSFTSSQKVTCSIRPEAIHIHDNPSSIPDDLQHFSAEILSLTYYGVTEHYILRSFNNVELKVSNFNPDLVKRKEGDVFYISFSPKNVFVFPAEV
jgi:iron(III) transport system ATP-binding protein